MLRVGQRHVLTDGFDLPDAASDSALDARLLSAERDAALWRAFSRISERCGALLRMLAADPAPSYDDVSAALDMPVGSIGPTRGALPGAAARATCRRGGHGGRRLGGSFDGP